nr:MAG TPA: hypothetical protein [Bacteriophage sp.]DAW55950.1 MAG TPA: hypothetical protein [Caudoviricetes sp.]
MQKKKLLNLQLTKADLVIIPPGTLLNFITVVP